MSRGLTTTTVSSARTELLVHRSTVFAVLATAVVVDQLTKAWAWRHAPEARINYGGNAFVGNTVSEWYADPVTGALLDFVDFGVLGVAVFMLARLRLTAMALIPGALMTGGWISNLLDRLGMHYWTAPGSVRGAVDFIPLGNIYYNVADVFIASGTLLFLVALGVLAMNRSTRSWTQLPHHRFRSRAWLSAAAATVCLLGLVGFGAVNYGGVTTPNKPTGTTSHP